MTIRQLGYVRCESRKLDEWESYFRDLLEGANVVRTDDEVRLQVDSMAARIIIREGDSEDIVAQGWEVPSHAALRDLADHAQASGFEPQWATDEERVQALVLGMFTLVDPSGLRNEIFYGPMVDDERRLDRRLAGRFLAGPLGAGHTAIFVDPEPYDACVEFYRDVLGLQVSGRRECDPAQATPITMFRCNARQHSMGLVPMKSPWNRRIGHFSVEYTEIDPLGRSYDYAISKDIVKATLGRHQADNTVSFYVETPSGYEFEVGWDSRLVPDDFASESYRPARLPSIWGHKREAF